MPSPPRTPENDQGVADRGCGKVLAGPFRSFWMGGFESACHINHHHCRLDMIRLTQHDRFADLDYRLMREFGLLTARDGFRWHLIETEPGRYDFSSVDPMLEAARRHGVQAIWNLCHYGWPEQVDLFSAEFVRRFAEFARAAAQYVADFTDDVPIYAPINEVSFLSWAIGERGHFSPFARGRANEAKQQFVRAIIAGIEAIWDVDLRARFVHTDPIYHAFAPRWRPDLIEAARLQTEAQYQGWDMISGRLDPQLGGHPCYLDVLGVNYYHNNQWEHPETPSHWHVRPLDDRRLPLHELLDRTWRRYDRPLVMTETSHVGQGRGEWLAEVTDEVKTAIERGVAIQGVCLYPIIDRPDWEDTSHWHNSGLWDLVPDASGRLRRVLDESYANQLRRSQHLLARDGRSPVAAGTHGVLRDAG